MKELIGNELKAINNLLFRLAEKNLNKEDSFSLSNMLIIGYIFKNSDKDIYQKDLEAEFSITRSTASKVLSLMEQKNFIIRKHVSHDARLKKIILTDKALEFLKIHKESLVYIDSVMTLNFSAEEKQLLKNFLERIRNNLYNELCAES